MNLLIISSKHDEVHSSMIRKLLVTSAGMIIDVKNYVFSRVNVLCIAGGILFLELVEHIVYISSQARKISYRPKGGETRTKLVTQITLFPL